MIVLKSEHVQYVPLYGPYAVQTVPSFSNDFPISQIHWIGFKRKSLLQNHGFYRQIYGFPVFFPIIQFYESDLHSFGKLPK